MPFLVPLLNSLVSGLAWVFRTRIGQWAAAALAWFGLSWATHEFAVEPWIDNMTELTQTGTSVGGEWGGVLVAYLGIMKFDVACTMIASAVAAKFAVGAAKAFLVKKA